MTELLPLNSRTGRFVQIPDFSCSAACKDTVMLHKDHCRLAGKNQLLYLNPRKNVDIIERFIPDIQMGWFTEAFCQKNLFALSLAILLQPFVKLISGKIQLKHCLK